MHSTRACRCVNRMGVNHGKSLHSEFVVPFSSMRVLVLNFHMKTLSITVEQPAFFPDISEVVCPLATHRITNVLREKTTTARQNFSMKSYFITFNYSRSILASLF